MTHQEVYIYIVCTCRLPGESFIVFTMMIAHSMGSPLSKLVRLVVDIVHIHVFDTAGFQYFIVVSWAMLTYQSYTSTVTIII